MGYEIIIVNNKKVLRKFGEVPVTDFPLGERLSYKQSLEEEIRIRQEKLKGVNEDLAKFEE